ncbi:MAG: ribonuclease H-like domain-containing protein [Alkaliphilus sp.]|nr:ribonuclease H-like domain-containing protein [Alkaliphilus sp.]
MKIKTFKIYDTIALPKDLAEIFNPEEYCVLDIETTGLNRKYHKIILIGILYKINNIIILKQFFAENPDEEICILHEFCDIFNNFSYVITYNGASFDIPFLKKRFEYNNLQWNFDNIKHIDILQCIRKEKKQLPVENFKLKTIEKFLGINRKDTISGKDSVLLYNKYVKHPSPGIEKTILLHNYEDVYYLNKLLSIFDHISIDKYELMGKDIVINYNLKNIIFTFYPKDISIKKGALHINGQTSKFDNIFDVIHYDSNFQFKWYSNKGRFDFIMPLYEGHLITGEKCNYINLDNFDLSKFHFSISDYYNDKFFHNNFMILKCVNKFNIDLIGELLRIIFKKIFQ